ncbi:3'-5' exonuclease [Cereibacter sphaeroides]|uniref:3'-5' exonuclease n=1 Tax=Cereibacter sphaeroides TaxID=1063 RepID=UPI0000664FC1|nr:Superfamily I DNA and RNA helicases-like protein [Cereibacter sphaeroides ATCC 17029]
MAGSFRFGARVADVARRHGVLAHQLSDWRRQARQGLLALPEEAVEGCERLSLRFARVTASAADTGSSDRRLWAACAKLIAEIAQQAQKKNRSAAQSAEDLVDVRFCAVGDDDQNIYDYGGASARHILEFEQFFPRHRLSELTQNYRSSGAIVEAAAVIVEKLQDRRKAAVISVDTARRADPLQGHYHDPQRPELGRVCLLEAASASIEDQADAACLELLRLAAEVGEKKCNWSSTAVLVRTRAQAAVLRTALAAHGINISYDLRDIVPFLRIRETILARKALDRSLQDNRWLGRGDLQRLGENLDIRFGSTWSKAIRRHLEEIGSEIEPGAQVSPEQVLEDFVEWARRWQPDQDGVAVMTAHSSKGLEFDNVLVLDSGWLGQRREAQDSDRRLLYVAATRARHSLTFVTSATTRGRVLEDLNDAPAILHRKPDESLRPKDPPGIWRPLTLHDVYLSFLAREAAASPGRMETALSTVPTGAPIAFTPVIHASPGGDFDIRIAGTALEDGHLGRVSRRFRMSMDAGWRDARVYAVVERNRRDNHEGYRDDCCRDTW